MHRGKQKLKVEFDVHVRKVVGLKETIGSTVFIAWRRGTNAKSGLTRRALVNGEGEALFDEHILFSGTVFRNASTGEVDDKALTISLKQVVQTKSSGKLLFKTNVNLGPHSHVNSSESSPLIPIALDKTAKKGSGPVLYASIAARPSKLNHQKLVPADPSLSGSTATGGGGMIKEIDGHTFIVDENDDGSDVSGTTVDSVSVASGLEDRELPNDPDMNESTSNSNTAAGAPSTTSNATTNHYSGSSNGAVVISLKKEIEMLQLENFEKTKLIADLQKTISELRSQLGNTATTTTTNISPTPSRSSVLLTTPMKPSSTPSTSHRMKISETLSAAAAAQDDASASKALEQIKDEFSFLEKEIYSTKLQPISQQSQQQQQQPTTNSNNNNASNSLPNITPTARNIFNKLISWKAFCPEKAELVGRVISAIDSASSLCQSNLPRLCYWLSTMCGLIRLARDSSVKTSDSENMTKDSLVAFDGRVTFVLFRVYGSIITFVISEIRDYLVPVILRSNSFESDIKGSRSVLTGVIGHVSELITRPLIRTLYALKEAQIPWGLTVQVFSQICYTITAIVFNHILTHKEDATVEKGFQIKMELSRLRDWLVTNQMRDALIQLRPLLDVATVFITDKSLLGDQASLQAICPSLTPTQVRRVLAFFPDTPSAIISKLKAQGQSGETGEIDETFMQRLSYEFLENPSPLPFLISPRKTLH